MSTKIRYTLIDALRGLAVVLMIIYHGLWDLIYLFGVSVPWFTQWPGALLQSLIRWTFILISGFCFCMGRHKWKRGLMSLLGSAVITAVTLIFMPDSPIHFGILSCLGSAVILTIPLEKLFRRIPALLGFGLSFLIFLLLLKMETGWVCFLGKPLFQLPQWLYRNMFTAYLGFPGPGFSSADYAPVLPWLFLFWTGFFLYRLFQKRNWLPLLGRVGCKPLQWVGRHALVIYMIHQPAVYGILSLIFHLIN